MRKTSVKILLCTACLAAAYFWSKQDIKEISDLTLSNIEALAGNEEEDDVYCFGSGPVDCYGNKVEMKLEGYSL